jgi:tetratricopeptide (TPR) repeat protein
MAAEPDPQKLSETGKLAFEGKSYLSAAESFGAAALTYAARGEHLLAAEMKNNQSVALLEAGKAQEALTAAKSCEAVFAAANDKKRQAMAIGNQAAALEALERFDEALAFYDLSATLFTEAGESDLRASVLKSSAAIKLRRGQLGQAGLSMIDALEAKDNPSLFERILKFILRLGS